MTDVWQCPTCGWVISDLEYVNIKVDVQCGGKILYRDGDEYRCSRHISEFHLREDFFKDE